ncbi:MAG: LysE family translocator, partial [Alphaproteobacteria bacterium]
DLAGAVLRGVVIGFLVAAPIGPVNLICIQRTVTIGRWNGFLVGQGAAVGDGTFAIVAAFGLTAISSLVEAYTTPLQVVGGTVLIVMGLRTFLTEPEHAARAETRMDTVHGLGATYLLTITNPATLLGFIAIMAGAGGLVDGAAQARGGYLYAAVLVFGVWLGSTLWWLGVTSLASLIKLGPDDRRLAHIHHGSGVLIFVFGLAVFAKVAGWIDF